MSKENVASGKKRKGAGCLRLLGRVLIGGVILLLVLVATGAIYQAVASARDAKLYKPVDQMVDVNGLQMRLDCRGSGSPTVVLEAGLGSPGRIWGRVQDDIAGFTRVCSYDRAGYGWSDPVNEIMYPDKVADMLHQLLENAGESPPYLMVGHSLGGVYVRAFAAQYPQDVVGMVFVDSSHDNQIQRMPPEITNSAEYSSLQKALKINAQVNKILASLGVLRAFNLLESSVDNFIFSEDEKEATLAELNRTSYIQAALRENEMSDLYFKQPEELRSLGDMPLIVLSAKADTKIIFENTMSILQPLMTDEVLQQQLVLQNELQDELAALSTRGRRIIVADTGHFIQIDQPQVVIDAIREVYEQVPR